MAQRYREGDGYQHVLCPAQKYDGHEGSTASDVLRTSIGMRISGGGSAGGPSSSGTGFQTVNSCRSKRYRARDISPENESVNESSALSMRRFGLLATGRPKRIVAKMIITRLGLRIRQAGTFSEDALDLANQCRRHSWSKIRSDDARVAGFAIHRGSSRRGNASPGDSSATY